MPCNFEVNLITRLGVIALFSSFFSSPDPKGHVTGTKNSTFVEDHPRNIPAKFGSNWHSGIGEEA
jgi:hypothetical protein